MNHGCTAFVGVFIVLFLASCSYRVRRVSKDVSRADAKRHWSLVDAFYNQPRLIYSADSYSFNLFVNVDFELEAKWIGRSGFEDDIHEIILNDSVSFNYDDQSEAYAPVYSNGTRINLREHWFFGTTNKVTIRNISNDVLLNDLLYFQMGLQSEVDTIGGKLLVKWKPDSLVNAPVIISMFMKQYASVYSKPKSFYRAFCSADVLGEFEIDLSEFPDWGTGKASDYSFSVHLIREQYEKVKWPGHFRNLELVNPEYERHYLRPLDGSKLALKQ